MRFTEANVLKLKPPAGKEDHWEPDEAMPGFGIRFRRGGPGVYAIRYSIGGRDGRQSFAPVATVTLADARAWARRQHAGIAEGINPALTRAKAVAKTSNTLEQLIGPYLQYLKVDGRSPRYVAENERTFRRYLRSLHRYGITDITKPMVAAEFARIRVEHGLVSGNHARAHLSALFGWAIREGFAETNPVLGSSKAKVKSRERVLSEAELAAIWRALGTDDYSDIVKLLVLTGARRDEIGGLRRVEVNFAAQQIELPGSRTKNGLPHDIPLSPPALSILERRRGRNSEFVFGRANNGFSGWSKCKAKLDVRLNLAPWVVHDLRRSFSTLLNGKVGVPPHIVEAALNHISGSAKAGVAGVYNRSSYRDEKRDAFNKWAAYVAPLWRDYEKAAPEPSDEICADAGALRSLLHFVENR